MGDKVFFHERLMTFLEVYIVSERHFVANTFCLRYVAGWNLVIIFIYVHEVSNT